MIGSSAQFTSALFGPSRPSKQSRGCGVAAVSQQAPVASPMRTGTRGTSEQKSNRKPLSLEQQSALNTPLDVLTDDLRFLQAKTGLDLLTPLQEVKEVHDQVVAALNPIAGEKMQEDLEGRITALQSELERAHCEVHCSEEQLESTIEELTRLEMAAHGFTEVLNSTAVDQAPSSAAGASPQEAASTSQQSTASAAQMSSSKQRLQLPMDWKAEGTSTQQQHVSQQQRPQPPDKQRSSGRNRQLQSDLDLPEQLQDFWYPVAFSSQMKDGEMVTMELFGQPWVLFRDAQGLPSCVKDACAHRACPLSLGSVVDGCIQCPYHGWQYDGSGNCTKMPSTAFCRGISVSTLPVSEAEGFVWVWPGRSVPEHNVPQQVTRPPDGFTVHAELILEVPVEHGLLLENLLDLAHAPFTHTSTFAKGWPVPDVVKFNAARMLGGNWEPYPIDMAFEPPCMVLSTIGLAQPGKIERGARAESCKNHLHQLHVCLPAGPGRTRLLYRMSMDFLHWTKAVPGIQAFWAHIAQQVMGEDLVLVAGQQDRMLRGADVWANPVAYDKLGVRYRRWRNSVADGSSAERAQAEAELRPMSAGELFNIPADGCQLGETCDVGDLHP